MVIGEFAAASSLLTDLQAAVLAAQHAGEGGVTSGGLASGGELQEGQRGVTPAGNGGSAASDGAYWVGRLPWGRVAVGVEEVRGHSKHLYR